MTLDEAEHHADHRRFEQAWAVLDDLPPDERTMPRSLQVRLRAATGLLCWDMGIELAALLGTADETNRACAAGSFHLLAMDHLQDLDRKEARSATGKAVDAWKPARIAVLEDNRLAGLF